MIKQLKLIKLKPKFFFVFIFVFLLSFAIAQIVITNGNVKAIKGSSGIPFPIYLDNNESVVGFQVEINYSTNYLIFQNIELTSRVSNATIVYNDNSPLVKIAVLVNNESDKISPGNGAVINIIFDVDGSAIADNYTISPSDIIISNISAISLPVNDIDGIFEIVEPYNLTFLPPINLFENFTLQEGATIPLKFNVTNNNLFINDNSVLVRIFNLNLGIDHTYNASGTGNDYVDINQDSGKYQINIKTGSNGLGMPEGIYNIEVTFSNYQIEEIGFELVDKSNGIGKGKQK